MQGQSGAALSSNGVLIHYDVQGAGSETLVLVHGWCCDRRYWRHQVDHLADRFTVVCVDLAGHGESGRDRQRFTISAFAEDVVAVVKQLRLDRVVLIGHSMSGGVIVEAARRLGSSVIDALADGAPTDRLARYFEFWLLRLQGVYPQLSSCPECGGNYDGGAWMPAREHHFVCRRCAGGGGTSLSLEALRFLRSAAGSSPEALQGIPLDAAASLELETAHRRLINIHLDKELKSARVLRQLR